MRDGNEVPRDDVASMFDDIAPVYDRLNTIMTFGLDSGWRRAAVEVDRHGLRQLGAVVHDRERP